MIREKAHGRDTFRLGPVLETLLWLKIIKKKKGGEGTKKPKRKGEEENVQGQGAAKSQPNSRPSCYLKQQKNN